MHHFDILILGGGASGWSLIQALLERNLLQKYNVGLICNSKQDAEKTWSFWQIDSIKSPVWQADYHWNELQVHFESQTIEARNTLPLYASIASTRFIEQIKHKAAFNNLSIIHDSIMMVDAQHNVVNGQYDRYKADLILKTFLLEGENEQLINYPVKQHFVGQIIQSDDLSLNPIQAQFMDFRVSQDHGFAFMYVLPYSENMALFEYTLFSNQLLKKEQYLDAINAYLVQFYGIKSGYQLVNEEMGVIPMDDRLPTITQGPNCYLFGTAAGMTKASTGYTFSRIQQSAKALARSIEKNGIQSQLHRKAIMAGISSKRYRLYDIALLDLLSNSPSDALLAFKQLFERNGIESMLRFLDEKGGILHDIKILWSSPKWHFIKAIIRSRKVLIRHLMNSV